MSFTFAALTLTFFGAAFTVTLQETVFPSAVAVIVAVPFFLAVIFPAEDTATTLDLLDFHVTVLFVAFAGATVAFNVYFSLTPSVSLLLSKVTFVTATILC